MKKDPLSGLVKDEKRLACFARYYNVGAEVHVVNAAWSTELAVEPLPAFWLATLAAAVGPLPAVQPILVVVSDAVLAVAAAKPGVAEESKGGPAAGQ